MPCRRYLGCLGLDRRVGVALACSCSQVYMILDEFFLAGEVQETSKQAILHRVQELDKLD